jgi:ferredoxin-thioredoxin reductase catalytic subunit
MPLTPHAADQSYRDDLAADLAARDLQSAPVTCPCGCETTRDTIGSREIDDEVLCPTCAYRLAELALNGMLADARGETRWGAAS